MTRAARQLRSAPTFGRRVDPARRRDPRPRAEPLLALPAPGRAGQPRAAFGHDPRLAPADDLRFFATSVAGGLVFFAAYLF